MFILRKYENKTCLNILTDSEKNKNVQRKRNKKRKQKKRTQNKKSQNKRIQNVQEKNKDKGSYIDK